MSTEAVLSLQSALPSKRVRCWRGMRKSWRHRPTSDHDEVLPIGFREACVGWAHAFDAAGVLAAQDPEESFLSPVRTPAVGDGPVVDGSAEDAGRDAPADDF